MKNGQSDRKRFLREARRLIRLRSVTTESNGTIACYVGKLLQKAGFKVRYQVKRIEGVPFYNVIGVKGTGKHPLLFLTHLDTVPPGPLPLWTKTGKNPWNPVVRGNRLYGLGSADTKLDILSKLFAAREFPERSMTRPLMIVGTFGEERGLLGARHFCEGVKPLKGIAFVSEPSGLTWVREHRGYLVLEVSLFLRKGKAASGEWLYKMEGVGKSAHSSVPHRGRNAIRLVFDRLEKLSRFDPFLRLLRIEGGSSPNQVPAEAKALFSTCLNVIPKYPFVQTNSLQRAPQNSFVIPREALHEMFQAIDRGIEGWHFPMTSTVGMIRLKGKVLQILIDFRVHPKDKNGNVRSFFEKRIKKVLRRHELTARFRIERDGPPLSLSLTSPLLRLARKVSRKGGIPFRLVRKPSCTEAGFLCEKGIPAVVFGPGKSAGNIHSPNEFNDIRQLEKAIQVYRALIQEYCL